LDQNQTHVQEDRREAYYADRASRCASLYSGADQLSIEAVFGMVYTYDLLHQTVSRVLAEYGLSKSTLSILMLLKQAEPEGMLLRDLGELMLVSKANITGLIDHLQSKGYVKRVVGSEDRRARYARLTKSGNELVERYAPVHYQNITEYLKDLTREEKERLIALLRKVRASVRANGAEPVLASGAESRAARS
jgi:MarR family transcriptional regulator, 2-MHQ and catechol-resistance regulon repressor